MMRPTCHGGHHHRCHCHGFCFHQRLPLTSPFSPCPPSSTAGQFQEAKGGGHRQQLPYVHRQDQFLDPSNGEAGPQKFLRFTLHMFAFKFTLQYKIRVSILGGDLMWIKGPYLASAFKDFKIFSKVFRRFFKPGEHVEANGSPLFLVEYKD